MEQTGTYVAVDSASSHQPKGDILIIILIVLFGQGSWIALNGLWVELPLLVSLGIPEHFALATWLVLIIQVANIGPLLFTLANYFTHSAFHLEVYANYVITALGSFVAFLLIFLWDNYSSWGFTGGSDTLHSTALLACAFLLSVVDCTSSVAFTPFMARFRTIYVTWYFIGEGFSSLTPSIVALVQGVSTNAECRANQTFFYENDTHIITCSSWESIKRPARFGPEGFFTFLFAMALACFLSYILLNVLPRARREQIKQGVGDEGKSPSNKLEYEMVSDQNETDDTSDSRRNSKSIRYYIGLFTVLGAVNALNNAVLPSVQSYSAGAYGLTTYLVAATLSCVSKPVASFLVLLRPKNNIGLVLGVTLTGVVIGAYCMMAGFTSPSPPLQHKTIGRVLIVSAWVMSTGCFTYIHATIGWILRQEPDNRILLIWFGGITQLGSLIGACAMFTIVNTTNALVPYYEDPCGDRPPCEVVEVM